MDHLDKLKLNLFNKIVACESRRVKSKDCHEFRVTS
jgi:hypothetical protein